MRGVWENLATFSGRSNERRQPALVNVVTNWRARAQTTKFSPYYT